jgi:hypothetical protein
VTAACAIAAAVTGVAQIGPLRRANRAATARIVADIPVASEGESAA